MLPSEDYRRTHVVDPAPLHQGLDSALHGIIGRYRRWTLKGRTLENEAERIHDQAGELRRLSDRRLRENLQEMAARFRRQMKNVDQAVPEALTLIVEAAERTTGLRPFPVQVMGAISLHNGYLVEMATGEGKSLCACLPAILAGWTGRPCHIVTVNDYLSARDTEEMGSFYRFCGLTAGCVTSEMNPDERRKNYGQSVVYTTSKELLADFLRDRLKLGSLHHPSRRMIRQMVQPRLQERSGLVLRGLDTVIVDEADSVLIDEAVTPLIISTLTDNQPLEDVSTIANTIARSLETGRDYVVDLKYRDIRLTAEGLARIANGARTLPGVWRGESRRVELVKQALTAKELYLRDKQYVVQDEEIVIVDEFTGRLMPNRKWSHGLHQAVEAMEGLEVTKPTETLARLSFQRFFRLFRKISGMTGTAREAAGEFWQIYELPVITIPTNRPCIRTMLPDTVFSDEKRKWQAIAEEIARLHATGRPLLVGTRSVRASEKLAAMLTARDMKYNLLNAIRHREEAQIVAAAGEIGRITIVTNMAGRGTDIKLGHGVAGMGGLHVIATERHESGRIDRQLFGRCARQGDPGSAQAFASAEDELVRRFLPEPVRKTMAGAIDSRIPGSKLVVKKTLSYAQKEAQRLAFKQRRNVLRMDTWLEDALSFSGPESAF